LAQICPNFTWGPLALPTHLCMWCHSVCIIRQLFKVTFYHLSSEIFKWARNVYTSFIYHFCSPLHHWAKC
jgi:hypothetical protein